MVMNRETTTLWQVLAGDLSLLPSRAARAVLRFVLALLHPWIEVHGKHHLPPAGRPALFVFNHNNSYECVTVPAALIFHRRGSLIRFAVDWMFLEIPVVGHFIRLCRPIPVYTKKARWGYRETYRRAHLLQSPLDACQAILERGESVGIFPEGTRNRNPRELKRGRRGLGRLILATDVPVVPVGIEFPARTRLGLLPLFGRVRINVGAALGLAEERQEARSMAVSGPAQGARRHRERLAQQSLHRVMNTVAGLCGKSYPFPPPATLLAERPPRDPITLDQAAGGPMSQLGIQTERILTAGAKAEALEVIQQVYLEEKRWIEDPSSEIQPFHLISDGPVSWILARVDGRPVGVLRLTYDPPLEVPAEFEVELEVDLDVTAIGDRYRFVEIGRFMILPEYRGNIRVALGLMRAAVQEVVERGYTHLLTDVFKDDPHSPYAFHTRVLGFQRVGTHRYGELSCDSQRIILVLDIAVAYQQLKVKRNRVFRQVCEGLEPALDALIERQVA